MSEHGWEAFRLRDGRLRRRFGLRRQVGDGLWLYTYLVGAGAWRAGVLRLGVTSIEDGLSYYNLTPEEPGATYERKAVGSFSAHWCLVGDQFSVYVEHLPTGRRARELAVEVAREIGALIDGSHLAKAGKEQGK